MTILENTRCTSSATSYMSVHSVYSTYKEDFKNYFVDKYRMFVTKSQSTQFN